MLWAYVISDLKDEKNVWTFHKKELQKTNQQELRVKKAIKRKVDQLCVKWKDFGTDQFVMRLVDISINFFDKRE